MPPHFGNVDHTFRNLVFDKLLNLRMHTKCDTSSLHMLYAKNELKSQVYAPRALADPGFADGGSQHFFVLQKTPSQLPLSL
jgi:hypothetical protein